MACSKVTLHPLEQYWADAYGKPGHVVEQPWTAIPAFSGSRPLGFKVVRLRQGWSHRLKIRPGDIIVSVAGRPTVNPDQMLAVMDKIKASHPATVRVYMLRGGHRVCSDYQLVWR